MTDLRRLARWLDAELLRAWPLTGGVSAQVTALEVRQGGQIRRLVVRAYGERDLKRRPDLAALEDALLGQLNAAGVPVPRPVFQTSGVLVTTFVEGVGGVEAPADPLALADVLAQIHAVPVAGLALAPLPAPGPPSASPDESLSESRIRAALAGWPPAPAASVLLHGDFWPGNTLWHGGRLAAVIDWEDAALDDPLADVGNARLELLWAQGEAAMQAFTRRYARQTDQDLRHLPYWDLRAALRPCGRLHTWGLDPATLAQMRARHTTFVRQALAESGA
ncbi:phosphotransferase family protein [Deinococcus hohokamensis]|uniref:Phosphotransferase family protein n=1 Tax=Deinococcus hohokamensis TaxID=309883 RepID=A0ABV9I7H2_9DEIO